MPRSSSPPSSMERRSSLVASRRRLRSSSTDRFARSQAWKDEAFELGALWASLYETSCPEAATAISGVFDTFYLGSSPPRSHSTLHRSPPYRHTVNIVYNDYRDPNPDAIFAPFYSLFPETSPSSSPKPEQANSASLAN